MRTPIRQERNEICKWERFHLHTYRSQVAHFKHVVWPKYAGDNDCFNLQIWEVVMSVHPIRAKCNE